MPFMHLLGSFEHESQGISHKLWDNDLFQDVDYPEVAVTKLNPLNQTAIKARIANLGATSYVRESDEDGFKVGTSFQNFHYQAKMPIFDKVLMAGF